MSTTQTDFPPTVMPPKGAPHLLGIDVTSIVHRCYHGANRDRDAAPINPTPSVLRSLANLLTLGQPSHVAFALDPVGASWRAEALASYKAHRPSKPEALTAALVRVMGILLAEAIPVLSATRYEADDMLATACATGRRAGMCVVLATHDKDMRQLVDATLVDVAGEACSAVTLWDGTKAIGASEVVAAHGVPPSRFAEWLALSGDSGDGFPGLPDVGPKRATALLTRTTRSLEQLIAQPTWIADAKMRDKVRLHGEALAVYLRLARLVDNAAPVNLDDLQCDPLALASRLSEVAREVVRDG
jgi:DNA polymerase-1